MRFSTLEIHKDECTFSAGHFTIFSATEREQLHGHNYALSVAFKFAVSDNGLSFDYRYYKKRLADICKSIDRHFLLPTKSPYLKLIQDGDYIYAIFNEKKIPFLREDIKLLPLSNITIEELAQWFLHQLINDQNELSRHHISGVKVKMFNGPGQSSDASWGEI